MSKNHFKCVLSAQSFVCVPFVHGTSRSIDSTTFEMIFGKLVRFLRQFRDTNRYRFVQAVPANNSITSSKMNFKSAYKRGTSRSIDSTTFEMIFGKLVRFLRQFQDTNQYLGIQAVSRNYLITPSKMIFRDTREVGTSQLFDPIAFENKGN